jgi:hypothetical protein
MLLRQQTAFGSEANSAVQLALLGCGGRGTAVATSFANNTSARFVALADLFPDKLEAGKAHFDQIADKLGYARMDPKMMFRGYKAFEEIAASQGVDAVQISTPPWFHVQHLDAAVKAGKHAYCEKPVGVDVAQAQQVLEIGKRAQGRRHTLRSFSVSTRARWARLPASRQITTLRGLIILRCRVYPPTNFEFAVGSGISRYRAISSWSRIFT